MGGAPIEEGAISAVLSHVSAFIGVDGGADHLLAGHVTPAAVIGDLDSLSDQARATFGACLHKVAEQSTTDFEKALIRVQAPCMLGLGFTGGRLDHTLSVLNVMARHVQKAVILLDAEDVSFIAPLGRTTFQADKDTRISIMPVGTATVTVAGVQWPFDAQRMTPDSFTSPSNAASGGPVTMETDGPVLITLPRAHLQTALQAAVRAK
ncbi:thiamine pyrophosphokinase [Roseobacter sp. CCS2]|nr:thiamine pyrophosphokinase [Roseobacter sp. CCS2]